MRIKCEVSYDGALFHGFVLQKNVRTVQFEIQEALEKVYHKKITIYAASRTDAGVHALAQVFHFDAPSHIPEKNLFHALNSKLPKDIYVNSVAYVDVSFHARFLAVRKIYQYKLHVNEYLPLRRNYMHFYYKRPALDIEKMKEAARLLIGTHDFRSFAKISKKEDTVRTIYRIDFIVVDNDITIEFEGNGFLHNMIRIIVGMLLEVGRGKVTSSAIKEILAEKNRIYAPKVAPACGLYLVEIFYT